jgi:(1->4)-alpha-D-glucan 1-alpha-D-glucosylmutase
METAGSERLRGVIQASRPLRPDEAAQDGPAQQARTQLRSWPAMPTPWPISILAAFSSQPQGRSAMHQLLERQHYRLAAGATPPTRSTGAASSRSANWWACG